MQTQNLDISLSVNNENIIKETHKLEHLNNNLKQELEMETNNFKAIAYLKTGNTIAFFGTMHDCAEFADKISTGYKDELTEVKIKNLNIKKPAKQTE